MVDIVQRDPFASFVFSVEINGIKSFHFKSVSGLSNQTDIYEYQEGGENRYTHKLIGQTTFSNIVLKRGVILDKSIYEWREKVMDGDIQGAKGIGNGTIILYERNREDIKRAWSFVNAWPCKWEMSEFNAMEDSIAIETLELVIESFTEERH